MGRAVRVTIAGVRTILLVAGVLPLTASPLHAQAGRTQVQEGNRLYEEGRFQEAHEKYLEGLAAAPGSGVIEFNDGNALYQGQDYGRAMEAYQRAIETGDAALVGSAWYNLGNALYRQQQLQESLEAYKQALRLAPENVDAKHNLERVLEQMQQQEDQQQEQPQDDQNQDQDQDPQGQQQDPQDQQPQEQDGDQEQEQQDQQPEEQDQGQQPQPAPGQMTPEEAQRLLDAIEEDPEEVNRQPAAPTGRRPGRPW